MFKNKNIFVSFLVFYFGLQNFSLMQASKELDRVGFVDRSQLSRTPQVSLDTQNILTIIPKKFDAKNSITTKRKKMLQNNRHSNTYQFFHSENTDIVFDGKGIGYRAYYVFPSDISEDTFEFLKERTRQICRHKREKIKNEQDFYKYKQKKSIRTYEKKRPNKICAGVVTGIIAGAISVLAEGACRPTYYRKETIIDQKLGPVIRETTTYSYSENTRNNLSFLSTAFMGVGVVAAGYALYHGARYILNFQGDNYKQNLDRLDKKKKKEIEIDTMVVNSVTNPATKKVLANGGLKYLRYKGSWRHANQRTFEARMENLENLKAHAKILKNLKATSNQLLLTLQ